jgi:hypothetical protein
VKDVPLFQKVDQQRGGGMTDTSSNPSLSQGADSMTTYGAMAGVESRVIRIKTVALASHRWSRRRDLRRHEMMNAHLL